MAGTKEMILDCARELFRERGYSSVSLRDIADRAGVRVGNLTYYYPKKEDLVEGMFLAAAEQMVKTGVFRTAEDVVEYCRRLLEIQRSCAFFFDSFAQIAQESDRLRAAQLETLDRLRAVFTSALRELAIFGRIPLPRSKTELADRAEVLLQLVLLRLPGQERRLTGTESDEAVLRRVRLALGGQ